VLKRTFPILQSEIEPDCYRCLCRVMQADDLRCVCNECEATGFFGDSARVRPGTPYRCSSGLEATILTCMGPEPTGKKPLALFVSITDNDFGKEGF
jgi:hypothetical protein